MGQNAAQHSSLAHKFLQMKNQMNDTYFCPTIPNRNI